MSYWYPNYHLKSPYKKDSENGILFLAYYVLLRAKTLTVDSVTQGRALLGIASFIKEPYNLSHDNITGLYALIWFFKSRKKRYPKMPGGWRRLHPRDLYFYGTMQGGIISWLVKPLFPVYFISMILSCTREKDNTSSKLLCWLRLRVLPSKLLESICGRLIKRKHQDWYEVFEIYFSEYIVHRNMRITDKFHPVVISARNCRKYRR